MNGIVIFNKPKGITSHDVVYMLRRKTGIKKIGHTGTLDPMATGVLVMCIGKATKVSEYITVHDKNYVADFSFGYETDTLDSTSAVIKKTDYIPEKESLEKVLESFTGKIKQIPPRYSALKINGKKSYELAREGIKFEPKEREVEIYNLKILKQLSKNSYRISITCSSGTYIRSLIRDIAYKLNSLATMESLIRTKVGNFKIEDSIDKEFLNKEDIKSLESKIIPIDKSLSDFKSFEIPEIFFNKIINGVAYRKSLDLEKNEYLKVYCKNIFIGIGQYISEKDFKGIKIKKMLKDG
ncbi:MAG: tRNA pseudouridine(55) synthase TruB [Peptoniphilaceae bacterium]